MAGLLTDFFNSLMGQQQGNQTQGVPFSQLISGDGRNPQFIAPQDNLSPEDQRLALQRMLQMRDQTQIKTFDPGKLWGGLDKNNMDPEDLKSESLVRQYRQERI